MAQSLKENNLTSQLQYWFEYETLLLYLCERIKRK